MDELDERLGRSMVIVIVSKEKHGTVWDKSKKFEYNGLIIHVQNVFLNYYLTFDFKISGRRQILR